MLAQNLGAEAMERVDGGALFKPRCKCIHPDRHLVRGLVGERQRKDAEALVRRSVQKPGDPTSEHARLPGAGAGKNEDSPVGPLDGLALNLRQFVYSGFKRCFHYASPRNRMMEVRNASGARRAKWVS